MTIYFIATKHGSYAQRQFSTGETVIDPWRYIPDQEGVTVKRIGENKPELISLLVPTRKRPVQFLRMVKSAIELATHPRRLEIIAYVDEDDDSYTPPLIGVTYLRGPRIVLSEMWNTCFYEAKGDILMHCGDDIVFRTPGWDAIVRETFAQSQDKLILVHGDDRTPNTDVLATHGFLHRRWVQTIGYFVPPYFSSDWNDVWLTEVADMVGRRVKIPIVTDHMHYAFDKSEYDITYREREERGQRDNVADLYKALHKERVSDSIKLKKMMV